MDRGQTWVEGATIFVAVRGIRKVEVAVRCQAESPREQTRLKSGANIRITSTHVTQLKLGLYRNFGSRD